MNTNTSLCAKLLSYFELICLCVCVHTHIFDIKLNKIMSDVRFVAVILSNQNHFKNCNCEN